MIVVNIVPAPPLEPDKPVPDPVPPIPPATDKVCPMISPAKTDREVM